MTTRTAVFQYPPPYPQLAYSWSLPQSHRQRQHGRRLLRHQLSRKVVMTHPCSARQQAAIATNHVEDAPHDIPHTLPLTEVRVLARRSTQKRLHGVPN